MKLNLLSTVILTTFLTACSNDTDKHVEQQIQLTEQGRFHTYIFDQSAAEIVTYDKITRQTFVVNAQSGKVDIIDSADIQDPLFVASLDVASDIKQHFNASAGAVNSVDIFNGLLAVAIAGQVKTDPGWVVFYNSRDLSFIKAEYVGALPDMLTFTKTGEQLIVAIEGEPSAKNYAIDPLGEIAIFDILWQNNKLTTQLTRLNFSDFNLGGSRFNELPKQLVLNGHNAQIAQDIEPEYVAVNANSSKAYIALQENNAIAVVDLETKSIDKIMALGFKDHLLPGNELDGNNKDKKVNIKNEPALGLYQPDSIAAVTINNIDYLITANEGDDRSDWISDLSVADCEASDFYYNHEDKICADDITLHDATDSAIYKPENANSRLDLTHFQAGGQYQNAVQRIKFSHSISKQFGDLDNDGKLDRLLTYGGRSFSVWNIENESLIFDSGSDFEKITAQKYGKKFNQTHNKSKNEDRSDNKGPEPEALTVAVIAGKTYAFIGLERMGGIMVYDISQPEDAQFVQYLNNRQLDIDPGNNKDENVNGIKKYNIDAGDLGPEGMKFVSAEDSPTKTPILIVGNEVSGTTSFYRIDLISK